MQEEVSIQIVVPPHCDPAMPLLGAHQLCGYARSLGISSSVLDLSAHLKVGNKNFTDDCFCSQKIYWQTIRHFRKLFESEYSKIAPYAHPTWDSAQIPNYKWNIFADQQQFIEDCLADRKTLSFYATAIEKRPVADYYFVSIMFPSQFLDGLLICYIIRSMFPNSIIVIGGGLITSIVKTQSDIAGPIAILSAAISIGEGEFLIRAISQSHWNDIIENVSKDEGNIRKSVLLTVEGFQNGQPIEVPFPAYNESNSYLTPKSVLPYRVCSSCYWNKCNFCTDWIYRSCLKGVSITEHVSRLKKLTNKASGVILQDSALSPQILYHFATEILKQKCHFYWGINARFDYALSYEVLKKARDSGCVFMRFGLESGSNKVLSHMNKGIDLVCARRILKQTRSLGILTHVYCIAGYPGETDEDRAFTREFLLDSDSFPDSFSMSQYIPYYASRGNFIGEICRHSPIGWHLYNEEPDNQNLCQYINDLEHDFSRMHPVFKTLVSPAHTIGSYDSIVEWK